MVEPNIVQVLPLAHAKLVLKALEHYEAHLVQQRLTDPTAPVLEDVGTLLALELHLAQFIEGAQS